MSESPKKQNFLQGAALLALATAIVKVIGAFYKLPLNMAIGAEGYSYFTTAYDIYSVMLLVSTAGLPVAVSRMVSQASTLGHTNRLKKVFRTSLTIFAILGAVSSVVMIFGAKWLANLMNQPDAWISIACLGPCGLLICLMSAYRGYFNGQGNMTPTSVTQVIEAFIKLAVGLALAFLLARITGSVAWAAGGAIIGVTLGSALALVYMLAKFRTDDPAVCRLVEMTVSAAKEAGIPVSVCGMDAGQPAHALRYIKMGVTHLSMPAQRIMEVKRHLRESTAGG